MPVLNLRSVLALVAPGTELRDGLDRILRGRTGAIVVLGWDDQVRSLCSGGFELDVELSASRLRELAKMDGAVVIDPDTLRIRRANVQLMPDGAIETAETGMRHRTAARVAIQTRYPVISVSQSMRIVTVYVENQRQVLESSDSLLAKANQALATLERYQVRAKEILSALTVLEIEDIVTVRDVVQVAQPIEMVSRIRSEIVTYIIELGTDGRLVQLQLEELVTQLSRDWELVLSDYTSHSHEELALRLSLLDASELANPSDVARALRLHAGSQGLETPLSPRGYRILGHVPRLPRAIAEAIITHMGTLQNLLGSTTEGLLEVEGVGPLRARAVREALSRMSETSIFERKL